jgi:hypothetical protein
VDAYVSGTLHEMKLGPVRSTEHDAHDRLRPDEAALLRLLRRIPEPRDLETALRESLAATSKAG